MTNIWSMNCTTTREHCVLSGISPIFSSASHPRNNGCSITVSAVSAKALGCSRILIGSWALTICSPPCAPFWSSRETGNTECFRIAFDTASLALISERSLNLPPGLAQSPTSIVNRASLCHPSFSTVVILRHRLCRVVSSTMSSHSLPMSTGAG